MFSLATKEDDRELRLFLRNTSMPGSIHLASGRHPSFFIAEQVGNVRSQVMVYRKNGKVLGVGSRAVRKLWVDEEVKKVGYLSSLRLAPEARGSRTLVRGYQFLRELHSDGAVDYYLSTILKENEYAQRVLEKNLRAMPHYKHIGDIAVCLIPIRYKYRNRKTSDVRRATKDDVPAVVDRLNQRGKSRQFSSVYQEEDLLGPNPSLPGLSITNFFISEKGTVQGVVAAWDQRPFKQTIVTGYSRALARVRPLYNAYATLKRRPGFPAVGKHIELIHLSHFVPVGDLENDLGMLLKVCAEYSGKGFHYATIGLSTEDPLFPLVRRYAEHVIGSKVYLVYWPDKDLKLPSRYSPFDLEVATL